MKHHQDRKKHSRGKKDKDSHADNKKEEAMETGVIFKMFAAEFKTKREADAFIRDIEKICKKHDPKGKNIQFTYEMEH